MAGVAGCRRRLNFRSLGAASTQSEPAVIVFMSGINTDGPAAGVHSFSRPVPARPARVRGMPVAQPQVAGNPGYFDPTDG